MKKALIWIIAMLILIIGSTIGYIIILDVSFVEALYMTIITISTVGYREVAPMNETAKWFTIGVILLSVGMMGYLLSSLFRFFSEGSINETWRKNKMNNKIKQLSEHYVVCGAGETGIHVVKQLKKRGVSFVVIEENEKAIEKLIELDVLYISADATKEETLIEARTKYAKGLITSLAKDADNVFIVLIARELNPNLYIVARAHEEYSHKKLKRAGANKTISPNEIGGKKMAALILNPNVQLFVESIIDTSNISIELEEVMINELSSLIGKKVKEAKIPEKFGLILLAIRRGVKENFIFNPATNETLQLKDKLIVAGTKEQIKKLQSIARDQEL